MLLIFCPHCEEYRSEEEFHSQGEAHIIRPEDPRSSSDQEWGDYLYFRTNPRGLHREMWSHSMGCGRFFNVIRNTETYEIENTYLLGETPADRNNKEINSDN